MQVLNNLAENFSKLSSDENKPEADELSVNINLDSLIYLASLKHCPRARFEKVILELKNSIDALINNYAELSQQILTKSQFKIKDKYMHFFEALKSLERSLNVHVLDLQELVGLAEQC